MNARSTSTRHPMAGWVCRFVGHIAQERSSLSVFCSRCRAVLATLQHQETRAVAYLASHSPRRPSGPR